MLIMTPTFYRWKNWRFREMVLTAIGTKIVSSKLGIRSLAHVVLDGLILWFGYFNQTHFPKVQESWQQLNSSLQQSHHFIGMKTDFPQSHPKTLGSNSEPKPSDISLTIFFFAHASFTSLWIATWESQQEEKTKFEPPPLCNSCSLVGMWVASPEKPWNTSAESQGF